MWRIDIMTMPDTMLQAHFEYYLKNIAALYNFFFMIKKKFEGFLCPGIISKG